MKYPWKPSNSECSMFMLDLIKFVKSNFSSQCALTDDSLFYTEGLIKWVPGRKHFYMELFIRCCQLASLVLLKVQTFFFKKTHMMRYLG